jgi:Pentapeptide repeats (8 copies)
MVTGTLRNEAWSVDRKKPGRKAEPASKRRIAWPRWTGFRGMTLREWLQLLIVPFALVVISFVFTMQQDARQQAIEDKRAEAERDLAEQRAQDEALQAYLDQMSNLLLEKNLRESEEDSEVRTLARARTLTVLGRLDTSRKTEVMRFLSEADLVGSVDGRDPVIGLMDADLSGANLYDAYLYEVKLSGADLSRANLYSAAVTQEQLDQARFLEGVIMPDGTINAERYATREFKPTLSFNISDDCRLAAPETTDGLFIDGPEGGQLNFTSPLHVFDPTNLPVVCCQWT